MSAISGGPLEQNEHPNCAKCELNTKSWANNAAILLKQSIATNFCGVEKEIIHIRLL